MAYLSNIRIDKKCGNSGVAEGKKCRKGGGGGSMNAGSSYKQGTLVEKAMIGGGMATAIGGIGAALVQGARGKFNSAHKLLAAANGGTALAGAGVGIQGHRQGNKRKQKLGAQTALLGGGLAALQAGQGGAFSRRMGKNDPREVGAQAWRNMRNRAQERAKDMGRVEKVTVREIPNSTKALPPARSKKRKDSIDFSSGLTASLFL